MAEKDKKSEAELVTLIMQEVRQHPDWDDILDVAIIRPSNMNWDIAFTMNGPLMAPEGAWAIARSLRAKYDVA